MTCKWSPEKISVWLNRQDVFETATWWLRATREGISEPEIDVRVGLDLRQDAPKLRFMDGLVDYDQAHYRFCAAGVLTRDTDVDDLAAEMLGELEEQVNQ